ncbi:MAG TPA: hypothetical protein VKQ08_03150, partial [Cyclobacteriaceae bacterium]|nr:hypothetical protein [Cyclobacteriaceae bacterium]
FAQAQVASSPFTKWGIGDLYSNGIAQHQGMGGIGISNPSYWYLNSQNPALLVYNRWTVFQGGMQIEKRSESDGTNTQSFASGNLNYLAMAFPVVFRKWTTSVGLTPYSHVNYNLSYPEPILGSNIIVNVVTKGSGGINQFYWANGVAINRYLSIGVKASYLFGSIVTQGSNLYTISVPTVESTYVRDYYRGLNLTAGISFRKDSLFGKKFQFNAGLIYSWKSTVNTQHFLRYESKLLSGQTLDSATVVNNVQGTMVLPQNYGVGLSFGRMERWTVGGDFTYLDNRTYTGPLYGSINAPPKNGIIVQPYVGFRTGVGAEITPKSEDFTNYLNRVTYRIGATFERSPFLVGGYSWNDAGGTFGFSLPVGRISTVDLSLKIGRRGTISQNSIEENYFRIYFGVTFGDQWFIKRKFD